MRWKQLFLLVVLCVPFVQAHGISMDYLSVHIFEDVILVNYSTTEQHMGLVDKPFMDYFSEHFTITNYDAVNGKRTCGWSSLAHRTIPGMGVHTYELAYDCGELGFLNFTYDLFFEVMPDHQVLTTFNMLDQPKEVVFDRESHNMQVPVAQNLDFFNLTWNSGAGETAVPESFIATPSEERLAALDQRMDLLEQSIQALDVSVDGLQLAMLGVEAGSQESRAGTPSQSSAGFFLKLGVKQFFTGYDHLLFLLGLIIVALALTPLIKTVTAFTIAHSLTLGAAVLGIVVLPPVFVEAMIALSIVYISFENLLYKQEGLRKKLPAFFGDPRYRWVVAAIFGLVHGFGFSEILRAIGLPSGKVASSLLSFNLGVEIGQIAVVLALFPIIWWGARQKWWRYAVWNVSGIIALIGLGLLFVRIL